MERSELFRKESMDRIQSPEQLNDYLRVTNPAMWVVLAAVIILLVGVLVWSASAQIISYASGTARVQDGTMVVVFDDAQQAANVETGMTISVGDSDATIASIGSADDGTVFAVAQTDLSDGSYSARVVFRRTQVLRLLFN